jgi:AcrR family transcriptional regulator
MTVAAQKENYHHGRLRDALLAAALEILEHDGLEALSLRRIAAKVGVSHAAPAHHFPTMKHLHTALATTGFGLFDTAMREARQASPPGPAEQMRASQRGYLAFAARSPALFRLMFTATLLDWDSAELTQVARAARQQLSEVCRPAAERHGLTTDQARLDLEDMVWSQVHGRASLMIDQKFDAGHCGPEAPDPAVAIDLATLLFGEIGQKGSG